jgi:hypothetical protein
MKLPIRAGTHVEGIHWVAEYLEEAHEIRVWREGWEVGVYAAPPTLFGEEAEAGSKSVVDHRVADAAVLAFLRDFVAKHDTEE